jgi:hypothetical protein
MGREIKRVPMNFDAPLKGTWSGYLMPEELHEDPCPSCERGYSWQYERLDALWYGNAPFDPAMTGSTPFGPDTPAIRQRAERNVSQAPEYYGTGEEDIAWEARRLARHFDSGWLHHLSQKDVDALIEDNRLREFTHRVVPGKGWQKIEPAPPRPTAAQINEWSLTGFGHDGINAYVVIKARCERYGTPVECSSCNGTGSQEVYPGQRAEAEAWERTEPPEGDGWQLWQTVSDGPISPVFATPEELARWMASPAYDWGVSKHSQISYESALAFITGPGWAPSATSTATHGVETGEQFMGRTELERISLKKEDSK